LGNNLPDLGSKYLIDWEVLLL